MKMNIKRAKCVSMLIIFTLVTIFSTFPAVGFDSQGVIINTKESSLE